MQDAHTTAQAASLAWQHAHPLTMVAFSTIGALVVVSLIVLIRWLSSSAAWRYHPGGGGGFLKDEAARWAAILAPWLVLSIAFRFYIYDLHPELNTPAVWIGFIAIAIAFRVTLRSLPPIKTMAAISMPPAPRPRRRAAAWLRRNKPLAPARGKAANTGWESG